VATEDAMPLADGGVVCNCDKPWAKRHLQSHRTRFNATRRQFRQSRRRAVLSDISASKFSAISGPRPRWRGFWSPFHTLSLNVTLPGSAVFFPGGGAPVDGIGLPGMVAFMMLVPSFLDPASVGKPRSKLLW